MSQVPNIAAEPVLEGTSVNGWVRVALRFARQRPLGAVGAIIILIMVFMAVLAEVLSSFNPLAADYGAMLQAPSAAHWLGTHSFCRDVLSRILYGSRTALWVGFAASFLGATLGAIIGVASAYFGGKIDLITQRF